MKKMSYGNRYMSENLGSVFLILLITCILLCLIVLLQICTFIPVCNRVVARLKKKLLWNFVLRLIIEGVLELFFCAVLNVMYGNVYSYDSSAEWGAGELFNFICACLFGSIAIIAMPWILLFYCTKSE